MGLGDTLLSWLQDLADFLYAHSQIVPALDKVLRDLANLHAHKPRDNTQALINTLGELPSPTAQLVANILSRLTGKDLPPDAEAIQQRFIDLRAHPDQFLTQALVNLVDPAAAAAGAAEVAQMIGDVVYSELHTLAAEAETDPLRVFAKAQAAVQAVTITLEAVGVAAEVIGIGQIQSVERAINTAIDMSGIRELPAALIAPVVSSSVAPGIARFYNRFYRQNRMSEGQLIDTYFHKLTDFGTLAESLAKKGWRDSDIPKLFEIAHTHAGLGDFLNAWDIGMVDDAAVMDRGELLGYDLDDVRFLLEMRLAQRRFDAAQVVVTTAQRLARKQVVSLDKYRSVLAAAHYPAERIDLEVSTLALEMDLTKKELTATQAEDAFKKHIIAEPEAVHYLMEANIDASAIPILIQSWKDDMAPKMERLNAAQITEAYNRGLFQASVASDKLKELGWSGGDAALLLKMADLRQEPIPTPITEGLIVAGLNDGLLSRKQAQSRLEDLGYTETDADFILRVATIQPAPKQKALADSTIAKLVELGVMSVNEAIARLKTSGYNQNDAELYLIAQLTSTPKPAATKKTPPPGA